MPINPACPAHGVELTFRCRSPYDRIERLGAKVQAWLPVNTRNASHRRVLGECHARRQGSAAPVPAWRGRRRRLAAVHGRAVGALRRDRAGPSGLRPLRHARVARSALATLPISISTSWRRSISTTSISSAIRSAAGSPRKSRSATRSRLRTLTLDRRRRHSRQRRAQGRHVRLDAGGARPQPVRRSAPRRAAAGAGR